MILGLLAGCAPAPRVEVGTSAITVGARVFGFEGPETLGADVAIQQLVGTLEPAPRTMVDVDPNADAALTIRLLDALPDDVNAALRGFGPRTVLSAGPGLADPAEAFCWHPMFVAPAGTLHVVPASSPPGAVPSDRPVQIRPSAGCPLTPDAVRAAVAELPGVCGPPSLVPSPGATWAELAPWVHAVAEATLLEAIPYARADGPPVSPECAAGVGPASLTKPDMGAPTR